MAEALSVLAGLATVAVWAWWKDHQNKKAHAELIRRVDAIRRKSDGPERLA